MIKLLRWKLTGTFVGLSFMVCVLLAIAGGAYISSALTASLDDQLRVMASEFGHAIDVRGTTPYFRDWKRVVQTNPPRSLGTIQLFSSDGKLLESYGPTGIPQLLTQREARLGTLNVRVRSTPLMRGAELVGYMQLQLSTSGRDEAVRDLWIMFSGMAPLMLIGLAITSYFVAGKAVRPLELNIQSLRAFLADAGHELNTPLTIIRARAESLQRKLERQGLDVADVKVITSSAERTTKLASDLMLLAEVESVRAPRKSELIDLEPLVRQVVQDFSDRFAQKGIQLRLKQISSSFVWASADDLYRAFANLLENALRYTNSEGTVSVTLHTADSAVVVIVEDTGIGIPPENLPFVFDRFYRVDASRARASGGFGLGLAIVKAIIDSHGGTVNVTSSVNSGTKFVISLPAKTPRTISSNPVTAGGDGSGSR